MVNEGRPRFFFAVPRGKSLIIATVACGILVAVIVFAWRYWSAKKTEQIASACRIAIRQEKWDEAQPLADQWVRRAPNDGTAWLSMADVAKGKGDLKATAECLARVPRDDSRFLKSQMLRGDLLLDGLGKPFEAAKVWHDMLEAAPNAVVPQQRLLYVYSMTLQRQKLVAQIRDAIQHRSEPPEAYGYFLAAPNLVFSDGYLRVGQWLKSSPDDEHLKVAHAVFAARTSPSKGMKMFGVNAVQAGDDSGVTKYIAEYPQNLELLAFLIEKAIADNDLTALAARLKSIPPEAESDCRFWRYIGTLRDFQRRFDEAAEAFRKAVTIHPMDWKSHHALAAVERALGNAEKAAFHADLGSRGKQLEREVLELPNAAQVDTVLLGKLLEFATDCGDATIVDGLRFRLNL